jgi:hypothetical protein
MGIFKSFARLQEIWDGDKSVCLRIYRQLATSWRQSMANRPNDLKLQNKLSSVV